MSDGLHPTPFTEVNAILNDFRMRLLALLRSQFLGMYVVGSLALGDFNPDHSDIDLIVVTDQEIPDDLFRELQVLHADFAASNSPWAAKIEAIYIPQQSLHNPVQNAGLYPQIEKGTALFKGALEPGWVFQCYTLREHSLVVSGPDPRILINPIKPEDMRPAVAAISGLWLEQAHHDSSWLAWIRQRANQIFVILTLCRMLYSLTRGGVVSKPVAAHWAQTELEQPWTRLITSALSKQYEQGEILQSEVDDTVAFIQLTVERSQLENFSLSS
jgi:hypothetical protein